MEGQTEQSGSFVLGREERRGGGLDENEWTSCCDNAMEIEDASGAAPRPRLSPWEVTH